MILLMILLALRPDPVPPGVCDCPPLPPMLPRAAPMLRRLETPEPPLFGQVRQDDDDRFFERFKDRIDRRVDKRISDSIEQAADDIESGRKSSVEGIFLVAAITRLVTAVAHKVIHVLIGAALLDFFWTYWHWIVPVFVFLVTLIAGPAGWAGGKKATAK